MSNVFVYTPFAVAPAEARRALIALHRLEFFQAWLRYLGWPRKRVKSSVPRLAKRAANGGPRSRLGGVSAGAHRRDACNVHPRSILDPGLCACRLALLAPPPSSPGCDGSLNEKTNLKQKKPYTARAFRAVDRAQPGSARIASARRVTSDVATAVREGPATRCMCVPVLSRCCRVKSSRPLFRVIHHLPHVGVSHEQRPSTPNSCRTRASMQTMGLCESTAAARKKA